MEARSSSERFFDAIARRYDRVYALDRHASRLRMARVIAALPPAPGRVLDLGVGTGRELPALLDAGYAVTGLEASREMIALCSTRARPVPIVRADFWAALPASDGAFDAAVALHGTVAHPPNPEDFAGALRRLGVELSRVVRPGGALVIEAPTTRWLDQHGGEGPLRRTGARTFEYEDEASGARITGAVADEDTWRAALDGFSIEVSPIDATELLVVGRRAR